jgi:hypothetical protein
MPGTHGWMPALGGALVSVVAVVGSPTGGPIAVTLFICHVSHDVTADVVRRLADGVDPGIVASAEAAAGAEDGVAHATRWPGERGRSAAGGSRGPGRSGAYGKRR